MSGLLNRKPIARPSSGRKQWFIENLELSVTVRGREPANRNVQECPEAGPRGRRGLVTGDHKAEVPRRKAEAWS